MREPNAKPQKSPPDRSGGLFPFSTGAPDLSLFFGMAQALHTNFHENWETQGFIEDGAPTVAQFIARLEQL